MHSRISSLATNSKGLETGEHESRQIFIGGLATTATERDLRELLKPWGQLKECRLQSYQDGRPRGFAFVTFRDPISTLNLLRQKTLELHGKSIEFKPALNKKQSRVNGIEALSRKLYVGRLPQTTTAEKLKDYFKSVFEVEAVHLIHDKTSNYFRNFGFVTLKYAEDLSTVLSKSLLLPPFLGRTLEIGPALSKTFHYSTINTHSPSVHESVPILASSSSSSIFNGIGLDSQEGEDVISSQRKGDSRLTDNNYRFNRSAVTRCCGHRRPRI